jgi:hypothetical protein
MLEYWVKRKDRKNGEKRNGFFYVFVLTHYSIIPIFQFFQCVGIPFFQHVIIPSSR